MMFYKQCSLNHSLLQQARLLILSTFLIVDTVQYKGNTLCTSTYMSVGTLEIQMEVVLGVILLELNGGSMIQALLVIYLRISLNSVHKCALEVTFLVPKKL